LKWKVVLGVIILTFLILIPLGNAEVVQLYTPIPEIVKVEPERLPSIHEGESTTLKVTVRNVGTEGGIRISIETDYYSTEPITETYHSFKESEEFTFEFKLHALNVHSDTETTVKVYVEGRGGNVTKFISGRILDVQGYSPTDKVSEEEGNWWLKPSLTPAFTLIIFFIGVLIGVVLIGLRRHHSIT